MFEARRGETGEFSGGGTGGLKSMQPQPRISVAACQYTATSDEHESLAMALPLLEEAVAQGADLICLPECANLMIAGRKQLIAQSYDESESPMLATLRHKAREWQKWILIGSLLLKHHTKANMLVNRCLLLTHTGDIHARYDKIHMFDVDVGDGQVYRESAHFVPGQKAVVAEVALAGGTSFLLGLTICYDLRFPHLYRRLSQAGAEIIAVPSAFTRITGQAHWHSLLRARAIENGVFIVAPAQCGVHAGKRETYGHALMVDPWGKIIAEADETRAVITTHFDMQLVKKARAAIPVLTNTAAEAVAVEVVSTPRQI